jgi:hypothetical protein
LAETVLVAGEKESDSRTATSQHATPKEERVAVEDVLASLELRPLSAIEVADEDEWVGRLLDEPKAPAGSEREWVALITSLRDDVQRLRVQKAGQKAAPQPVRADRKSKPVQDEWGFFDPEQCGFAALLAKLDEVTESEDSQVNH